MCPQYLLERLLNTGEVKNTGSAKFGGGGGWWLNLASNLVPRASPLLQPFRSRPRVLCVSFIRAMVNGCFFVSNHPRSLWYNNVSTGVFNWISGALHSRSRGNYERGKQRNSITGKNEMTSSIGYLVIAKQMWLPIYVIHLDLPFNISHPTSM